ncbi:MAG: hypothetical protein ACYDBQ_01235 [Thermoplasmatota archaeon]
MRTNAPDRGLAVLAAKAAAHYAQHQITLPTFAGQRTLHVHEGTTGHNVCVKTTDAAVLLARKPLRLRYSSQTEDGHLMEAVVLVGSPRDALRVASIFVQDFGINPSDITIVKEGTKRFHVVAGGPFRGLNRKAAARILSYLQPQGFTPPNGPARNRHQQCYQTSLETTLETWKRTPAPVLEEHLRKNTPLGNAAERVMTFVTNQEAPANLAACPPLQQFLHTEALRATFPRFNLQDSLDNPLIPVPGSIWLPEGVIAQAIPLEGESQ